MIGVVQAESQEALATWERAAALYLPIALTGIACMLRRRQHRQFAASLLGVLWVLPSLLALQLWNLREGWWDFPVGSVAALRGMPLEMMIGWAVLWGVFPQIALAGMGVARTAAVMIALDCVAMPLFFPSVVLHSQWLVGELAAAALVLLPALCLGEWTRRGVRLQGRAMLQIGAAAMLFLFFFPEIAFAILIENRGWQPLLGLAPPVRTVALQAIFLLALPGISAVLEFAERGGGTPIPYDPPTRLVTSGIYRYCANPMQFFCLLVLLAWAALLRNPWLCLMGALTVAYSMGIARWDEHEDLDRRFGKAWRLYRAEVHAWRLRWQPFHAGPVATLYLARSCGPCREVRDWLERRLPTGLQIMDAEKLPTGSTRRMRYEPEDGTPGVSGIRAFGRALEHLHLGWALCGCMLRLPGVWQTVQLAMDAAGLGSRTIVADCEFGKEVRS